MLPEAKYKQTEKFTDVDLFGYKTYAGEKITTFVRVLWVVNWRSLLKLVKKLMKNDRGYREYIRLKLLRFRLKKNTSQFFLKEEYNLQVEENLC